MRVVSILIGLLLSMAFIPACGNGTGLSGGSKEEKKEDKNQQTTLDGTQADGANNRPSQEEAASEQDEEDDSDLTVIPPEVVSAAYLTCTSDTGTTPDAGEIHLGCTILMENGEAFDVPKDKQDWSLKNKDGVDVAYRDIEVQAASRFHKIYSLSRESYDAGVSPIVNIEASDGAVLPVKKKGVVRINGKETD